MKLTKRERDVLNAICDTGDITQAAESLGIKEWTIRDHLKRLRRKAGVNSTLQLVTTELNRRICRIDWLT